MIQRLRGKNGKTKGLFIREKSILSKLYYPVRWIIPLTEYRHPIFDNFVNIEGGKSCLTKKKPVPRSLMKLNEAWSGRKCIIYLGLTKLFKKKCKQTWDHEN